MDARRTAEHAERLRRAMGDRGIKPAALADLAAVSYRTVTNWISHKKPTMPSDADRATLRRIFGDYDKPGDPVEHAIRQSRLIEWRQDSVIAVYKRNLHEQGDGRDDRSGIDGG